MSATLAYPGSESRACVRLGGGRGAPVAPRHGTARPRDGSPAGRLARNDPFRPLSRRGLGAAIPTHAAPRVPTQSGRIRCWPRSRIRDPSPGRIAGAGVAPRHGTARPRDRSPQRSTPTAESPWTRHGDTHARCAPSSDATRSNSMSATLAYPGSESRATRRGRGATPRHGATRRHGRPSVRRHLAEYPPRDS